MINRLCSFAFVPCSKFKQMKISLNWLKKYIELNQSPEEISQILTDIGLEVEGIESYQTIKGGLEGVVTGKVLSCEKHPNADKLSKTTVDLGTGEPTPIVCGAPNVAIGQAVLVATVGTTLYSGEESFVIKKSKIRGEVSEGMICAEDELGLGTSHDGIMVLDDDPKPGTPASSYFDIENDIVFEIGLTPNRIDAASHIGVARDLSAYFAINNGVSFSKPSIADFAVDKPGKPIELIVENNTLCPRYTGVVVENITIAPSPDWLQHCLKAIGLNPINNVVDITNFVLHETGQPLHAFDLNDIAGHKVVVGTMPEKTKFVTLDGEERELSSEDLMICNASDGMCIAGVFGGEKSGVKDSTVDIFLESAYFNPVSVRKTAKRHAINTDSSFRFERGIDPNGSLFALKRAAMLIKEIAGGTIASDVYDTNPEPIKGFDISLSIDKVNRLIGKEIGESVIESILCALEIEIKDKKEGLWQIVVPPYRVDVQRQEDVIEDILRLYGYNNIEIPTEVKSALIYSDKIDLEKPRNMVADFLVSNGFFEIMCNSLTKKAYYEVTDDLVEIFNPLSSDLNVMRKTLLYGALESAEKNINHKRPNIKFFEFGNVYRFDESKDGMKRYAEEQELHLLVSGKDRVATWNGQDADADYYFLKSYVGKILEKLALAVDTCQIQKISGGELIGLEVLYNTKKIAQFGMVSSNVSRSFGIDAPVYSATLFWDVIVKAKKQPVLYRELPKFPSVKRDLSLLIDEQTDFETLKEIAFKTEKKLLKEVKVFDVFNGKGIPEGKKSYALSFILQDTNKTLVDKQIDKTMNAIVRAYQQQVNAELR